MAYRDVKVYDDPFPTHDQILSGDPTAPPFPKEAWLQKVNPGEFAVRYKDFKSGLARNPQGQHVQASEICRVFDNLAEARSNSLQITKEHWTIRCFIYDQSGEQIDSISNTTQVNRFALAMYAGILFWATLYAVAVMALIWGVYRGMLLLLAPGSNTVYSLNWLGWCGLAAAGAATAIFGWYMKLRLIAVRRVKRMRAKFTPEEMKKFAELNVLHGTADPTERERFLKLMREYQQKASETLKE